MDFQSFALPAELSVLANAWQRRLQPSPPGRLHLSLNGLPFSRTPIYCSSRLVAGNGDEIELFWVKAPQAMHFHLNEQQAMQRDLAIAGGLPVLVGKPPAALTSIPLFENLDRCRPIQGSAEVAGCTAFVENFAVDRN